MKANIKSSTKVKFKRDGYVSVPQFLDKQELALLNQSLDKFIQEVVPKVPEEHVVYEEEGKKNTLKQLLNLHDYDCYFSDMLFNSKFKNLAELLLEENVIGRNVEFFNKPPKIGRATPPHQDNYYFMLNPPAAITIWLALEKVDEQNGCVRYVKGSHLKGMRIHKRTKTLGFSQGIDDFGSDDLDNETAITAKPGDLLAHHAMTIHRADGNKSSNRSRRALGLIYFAESAIEDIKAKREYQKILASEIRSKD